MISIDQLETTKNRLSIVASIVGFDVFKENFKFNILSNITIFDIISYMIINTYDIKLFWGDLIRVCFCLVTWSFGIQGTARIIVFVSKKDTMITLYNQVYEFMEKMERQMATNAIVRRFSRYIDLQTKIVFVLFYGAGVLSIAYPLFVNLLTKKIVLPFGFVIPGLSDTENPGYALNYAHHFIQVVLTVSGLVAVQCYNIIFLLGASLMIEVLTLKIRKLGKDVLMRENIQIDQDVDMSEIVELHQNILEFVRILESLFSVMFLIDVFSISFQMIITLMVCTNTFWIPGYMVMILITSMLLIDCAYGLYIEVKFDILCTAVYDLPWYLMSIHDRKNIMFILARTQKPPLLTFGKMAYMNMATFVQVYKSIYSYLMVLKSFQA